MPSGVHAQPDPAEQRPSGPSRQPPAREPAPRADPDAHRGRDSRAAGAPRWLPSCPAARWKAWASSASADAGSRSRSTEVMPIMVARERPLTYGAQPPIGSAGFPISSGGAVVRAGADRGTVGGRLTQQCTEARDGAPRRQLRRRVRARPRRAGKRAAVRRAAEQRRATDRGLGTDRPLPPDYLRAAAGRAEARGPCGTKCGGRGGSPGDLHRRLAQPSRTIITP
jgi:hypothetical protein